MSLLLFHKLHPFQRSQNAGQGSNIIPPKFINSPVKFPRISNISLPCISVPQAISITAPTPEIPSAPQEKDQLVDDKVAAFWDYQFLFVSQRSETAEPIPLNFPLGPGLFTDNHGSTVHPLDGHGYLRTFKIDGARRKVEFMASYIQTEAQVEERNPITGQWRFTHRGLFSVLKGGKMVGNTEVMKNVANTSVLRWGGRLFCLWEGGDPYEIEYTTLDTVGMFNIISDTCKLLQDEKDVESEVNV